MFSLFGSYYPVVIYSHIVLFFSFLFLNTMYGVLYAMCLESFNPLNGQSLELILYI
jgi:hypothetical protein